MTERPTSLNHAGIEREELPVDVLLVGTGPASLACAIQLKRLLDEGVLTQAEFQEAKQRELNRHR